LPDAELLMLVSAAVLALLTDPAYEENETLSMCEL
jgi:hypothetical protein